MWAKREDKPNTQNVETWPLLKKGMHSSAVEQSK